MCVAAHKEYYLYPDGSYRLNRGVGCLPCRTRKLRCSGGSVTKKDFWVGAVRAGPIDDLVREYKRQIGFVVNPSWKRGAANPAGAEPGDAPRTGAKRKSVAKRANPEPEVVPMPKRLKTTVPLLETPGETYRIPGPDASELYGPELPPITFQTTAPSAPSLHSILQDLRSALNISSKRDETLEERVVSLKNQFWSEEFRDLFSSLAGPSGARVKAVDALAIELLVGEQAAHEIHTSVSPLAEWQGKVLAAERTNAAAFASKMQSEMEELRSAYLVLRNEAGGYRDTMVKMRNWMERFSKDMHAIANTFSVLDRSSAEGLKIVRQSVMDVTELQANLEAIAPRQAINEKVRSSRAHIPSPPRDP